MKLHWMFALVLTAMGACFVQANLSAGDKKKDDKKEPPQKEVIVNGELTNADLKDKTRTEMYCKTYTYKMIEGKNYQIDMKDVDKKGFDPYLRLENSDGVEVAADDDSGGFPNALIRYRAPKTGDYTIICTTFGAGMTGKFTLIVKDLDAKDPPKKELERRNPGASGRSEVPQLRNPS
jgi:hypothetical protein